MDISIWQGSPSQFGTFMSQSRSLSETRLYPWGGDQVNGSSSSWRDLANNSNVPAGELGVEIQNPLGVRGWLAKRSTFTCPQSFDESKNVGQPTISLCKIDFTCETQTLCQQETIHSSLFTSLHSKQFFVTDHRAWVGQKFVCGKGPKVVKEVQTVLQDIETKATKNTTKFQHQQSAHTRKKISTKPNATIKVRYCWQRGDTKSKHKMCGTAKLLKVANSNNLKFKTSKTANSEDTSHCGTCHAQFFHQCRPQRLHEC